VAIWGVTLYVRPDRPGRGPSEIRSDITACEGEVQKAYSDVSVGYKFTRFMTSYYTGGGPYGGGVNIQRGALIKTFGACMLPRGYAIGPERQDVVPGR
jgi:hypothetical protein